MTTAEATTVSNDEQSETLKNGGDGASTEGSAPRFHVRICLLPEGRMIGTGLIHDKFMFSSVVKHFAAIVKTNPIAAIPVSAHRWGATCPLDDRIVFLWPRSAA